MRSFSALSILVVALLNIPRAFEGKSLPQLSKEDAVRVAEFYRLASETENGIWPGWSKVPAPLMLVTTEH